MKLRNRIEENESRLAARKRCTRSENGRTKAAKGIFQRVGDEAEAANSLQRKAG